MLSHPRQSVSAFLRPLLAAGVLAALGGPAAAQPVLGFIETFPGVSTSSWSSGSTLSNPGTGGLFGTGDGFLEVDTPIAANWGANSSGPEYTGNWTAAGITQVHVWLKQLGGSPLEVHFSIGNVGLGGTTGNFWQYNVGFVPSTTAWGEYVVDLTSTAWTQIITSPGGTLAQALQNVNRILLRHDVAPYIKTPDAIAATGGIDQLLLTNGIVGVPDPRASRVPVVSPVRLSPPSPNPSRGPVALTLESFDRDPITVRVIDAQGRSVRHEELAGGTAGPRTWMWDGRDDQGVVLGPGYYRVLATGAAGGMSQPLVRVR